MLYFHLNLFHNLFEQILCKLHSNRLLYQGSQHHFLQHRIGPDLMFDLHKQHMVRKILECNTFEELHLESLLP